MGSADRRVTLMDFRVSVDVAEAELHRLFIDVDGTRLRKEDRKKAQEMARFLEELARLGRDSVLVDAAAGKSYVGLMAASLLGWRRIVIIERESSRLALVRKAAVKVPDAHISIHGGDVGDASLWPEAPDVVAALHACGPASDKVLDQAVAKRARWILLVPCCYSVSVTFAKRAEEIAIALGIPRHAEVRRRFVTAMVDAERTLRLEAAGYETTVLPLVPPTVTPHNLLWRARWSGEPRRMAEAQGRWQALTGGIGTTA